MKKFKWMLMLVLMFTLALVIAGCGSDNSDSSSNGGDNNGDNNASANNDGEPITLNFAYEDPTDHPWGHGAEEFQKVVEEKTDGMITIEIYGNGQMGGSGREIQEGAIAGTIDIGI